MRVASAFAAAPIAACFVAVTDAILQFDWVRQWLLFVFTGVIYFLPMEPTKSIPATNPDGRGAARRDAT